MRHFDAGAIDARPLLPALIEALAQAFRGGFETPVRHHHHVARPDGDATCC